MKKVLKLLPEKLLKYKKKCKASLTVEAAFVVPLSFYALLAFLYLFIYQYTEFVVYQSMVNVSEELYEYGTVAAYVNNSDIFGKISEIADINLGEKEKTLANNAKEYLQGVISSKYIAYLGNRYLEDMDIELSCIDGKNEGVDWSKSYAYAGNGNIYICARYTFLFPIPFFNLEEKRVEQTLELKGFYGEGWEFTNEFFGEEEQAEDENTVYITEKGSVYHFDKMCTYISVNLKKVSKEQLEEKRNFSGAKYYACESCGDNPAGFYYITDYGTRYHTTKSCSKVERNVKAVNYKEALEQGKSACKKCGKEEGDAWISNN